MIRKNIMKRITCILWGLFVSIFLLTACRNGNPPESEEPQKSANSQIQEVQNSDPVEAASRIPVLPLTDYVSEEEMTLADNWTSPDDTALASVMKKALSGEKVTIACIGGSITQGTISNGIDDTQVGFQKCYADIFFQWWSDTFPETDFTFINAGIGATDSYIGVHRVQKDVLDYDPDLVLVEFSVNDGCTSINKRNYDNLVRRILLSEGHPAVMLLFMGQTNGASAQSIHSLIGLFYHLPMVSYLNVINDMMANDIYTQEQLSGDTTHPSALGHAIAGEIIWKYLNQIYSQMDCFGEPEPFSEKAVTSDVYLNPRILDRLTLTPSALGTFTESSVFEAFPNDWSCEEGDGNLTFSISFERLGFLYYCTTDGKSGQFDVYIDGEKITSLDADFSGGWGNYAAAREVYVGEEPAEHIVTIKKAPDSTGDHFALLGVLVSDSSN